MKTVRKYAILAALAVLMTPAVNATAMVPNTVLPFDPDPYSTKRIAYTTLNKILRGSVLKVGASDHRRPPPLVPEVLHLIHFGNPQASRFEGNRVRLHEYKGRHKQTVYDVRDALLALGDKLPIENYNKSEQLAYWLNLHNSIVFAKILEIYPTTNVKRLFSAERHNSFFYSREFSWRGNDISLSDIQNHAMDNWDSPLVIYGFYLGAIGTPNIRDRAFSGASVYRDLASNAVDFVNSVRGTYVWGRGNRKLHVSTFYRNFARKFPNYDEDMIAHIRQFAKPAHKIRLESVEIVDADISDWHVADIYNGRPRSVAASARYVSDFHLEIRLRRFRSGVVTIEELTNFGNQIEDIIEDIDGK